MTHHASKILLLFCALLVGAVPAYAQLDTNGLIAHWSFNGNLNDVTGKGHNALATKTFPTIPYTPSYSAGINKTGNTACLFDTTFFMAGAYQPDLNLIKQFSICAVIKFTPLYTFNTILYRDGFGFGGPSWGAQVSRADSGTNICLTPVSYGNIPYNINERQPYQYYPSTVSDKWYYMVVTYDGTAFKTYVNGVLKSQYYFRNAQFVDTMGSELQIGYLWENQVTGRVPYFSGLMDDLRLYNRALSDSEIVSYPFNFYDTTVVLNMPPGDSVICSGILLDVKHLVSKPFRNTNVFSVQMSDTNGSFATPIQIGSSSTNISGTIPCIIPPATPSGRYKIRLIATAPADTTLEFDVNYHPVKNMTAAIKATRHGIVSFYPPPNGMCIGDSMVFTIGSYTGMGEGPAAYRWQKNGIDIAGATSSVYRTKAIDNMDSFRCILKSNHACWFGDTAASNHYSVRVDIVVTPTVSIAVAPSDSICLGEDAIFHITHKINAGNLFYSPRWFVKNKTTTVYNYYNDSFSISNLKHLDTVYTAVTSNLTCALKGEHPSNYIIMHVDSNINPPKATITAQPGNMVPEGTDITFTAHATDTGDAPIYQWLKNNQPMPGATGKTFFAPYPSLSTGDRISLFVRNTTGMCANPDTVISNGITVTFLFMDVNGISGNTSPYSIYPNPNTGSFVLEGTAGITEPIMTTLIDVTGRILYNKEITPESGRIHTTITLENNIPSGIYLLRLSSPGGIQILRVTVSK